MLKELSSIESYCPDLQWYYPIGLSHSLRLNFDYLRAFITRRLTGKHPIDSCEGRLDRRELLHSRCTAIYCHTAFPGNASPIPVLWRNTILDPEMQVARGVTASQLKEEARIKGRLFEMAAAVHVSTRAEVQRLTAQFPHLSGKFFCIPYFLPYLNKPSSLVEVLMKHSEPATRVLFVGRHAKRKGLDLLLEAATRLTLGDRADVELHIVSSISDGRVSLPKWKNLFHYPQLTRRGTLDLMAKCQILAMPSRYESYGIAYIEALCFGTVPIFPDWEVQRELAGDGTNGAVTALRISDLAASLARLIDDRQYRAKLALAAVGRFNLEFHPSVVAHRFQEVLTGIVNLGF